MSIEEYIIVVYCWVSDNYKTITKGKSIRRAGFSPKLSDAEIITMELVGEFLRIDTDKGIWEYFLRHWHSWFPQLGSRSQFSKQASNLFGIKQELYTTMLESVHFKGTHIVDGFPIPVCHQARASRCKRFSHSASKSYCASKKEYYYGFEGHLIIDENGVIVRFALASANIDERKMMSNWIDSIEGVILADKGYIGEDFQENLRENNIELMTTKRKNMKETRLKKELKEITRKRRLVETVISQLTERFNIAKVWARDLGHLVNRVIRKLLSHTLAVKINLESGKDLLQFEKIIK